LIVLPKYLQLSRLAFWKQPLERGVRTYKACCALGPLFIKLGQMVSIRYDLFPLDIVKQLVKLQDQVPPESYEYVISSIEQELDTPIHQTFNHIDQIPLGSASIAQVHRAVLKTGEIVAIKVLRPNINQHITLDLYLIKKLINFSSYYKLGRKLLDEYEFTLEQELNLKQEAAHYAQTKHHFEGDQRLYVPKVYWKYSTKNMLVTEYIDAINIRDIHSNPLPNMSQFAINGLEIFFTQVFEHRFFHADMHPGNILVDTKHPHNPKYIAIDFGIVGVISEHDQYYLIEIFIALYHRHYAKVAKLLVQAEWVEKTSHIHQLESMLRGVCEPIFALPISEISMSELMQQLILASKHFNLKLQPQLLMLQKTLFHVEAMGRTIDPSMNLIDASGSYMKKLLRKRNRIQSGLHKIKDNLPFLMHHFTHLKTTKSQVNESSTQPHTSKFVLISLLIGALISAPYQLTKAHLIYIITNIIIIKVTWKKLRPKDFA
jgi:ubiquinone biosynthesis protein